MATKVLIQDYITMIDWNKKNCNLLEYSIVVVISRTIYNPNTNHNKI